MSRWPDHAFVVVPPPHVASDLAMKVRRAALEEDKADAGPCDIERVCSLGGFRKKVAKLKSTQNGHEALLVPRIDGMFEILVDPSVPSSEGSRPATETHRLRFRLAHEIGHTFFFDRMSRPPKRLLPPTQDEETFCDLFASALLVPPHIAASLPVTPASVFTIRDRFEVSAHAAARSLAQTHPDMSVAGLMFKPNARTLNEPAMRVVWSAGTRFVPENARLHSEIVAKAQALGTAEGIELLGVGGLKGQFHVSATMNRNGRLMIVVLTPL